MSGEVVHFEIPVDDVDRARAFYKDAFGWQINPVPDMDYTLVGTTPADEQGRPKEPGSINGGLAVRQAPINHPLITVDVDDIDAALPRIEQLGGKTVAPKMPIGDMGFAAYFADSEGNVLGLFQSA